MSVSEQGAPPSDIPLDVCTPLTTKSYVGMPVGKLSTDLNPTQIYWATLIMLTNACEEQNAGEAT